MLRLLTIVILVIANFGDVRAQSPANPSDQAGPSHIVRPPLLRMEGAWAVEGTRCDDSDGVDLVRIDRHSLQGYEHRCEFTKLELNATRATARADCRGEGRAWRDTITFAGTGRTMVMTRRSDRRSSKMFRCG